MGVNMLILPLQSFQPYLTDFIGGWSLLRFHGKGSVNMQALLMIIHIHIY